MKSILAVFFAFLILAGSSSALEIDKKDMPGGNKEITDLTDPARPIAVKKGETFSIRLASNPTTGYRWRLAAPLDGGILTEAGNSYERPASMLIGAGGREIWNFTAVGKGKTTVEMEYVRQWEKGAEPANRVSFNVTVLE